MDSGKRAKITQFAAFETQAKDYLTIRPGQDLGPALRLETALVRVISPPPSRNKPSAKYKIIIP